MTDRDHYCVDNSISGQNRLRDILPILFHQTPYLPPVTKLGQGNICRNVCEEFCLGGGGVGGGGGHAWQGHVCGRGHAWQGACMAGGACMAEGACVAGVCVWQRGACVVGDVRAWRAVRILLECILVICIHCARSAIFTKSIN